MRPEIHESGLPKVCAAGCEEDVGPDLVDGAGIIRALQASGDLVDPSVDRNDPVWWKVQPEQTGGSIDGSLRHDPTRVSTNPNSSPASRMTSWMYRPNDREGRIR